jgi:hypothetical protein
LVTVFGFLEERMRKPAKPPKPRAPAPTTPPPRARRTPASDAELAALSTVTPSDIARARAAWEADAPPPLRRLLDAKDDAKDDGSAN